jgi:hypothetical protein
MNLTFRNAKEATWDRKSDLLGPGNYEFTDLAI